MSKTLPLTVCSIVGLLLTSSALATASSIYVAPYKVYQNTSNEPCVFYGPGNECISKDPAGWKAPVGPTNQEVLTTLTQTYDGLDFDQFMTITGGAFVVGLDINDTSTSQTLSDFSISFFSGATLLTSYVFAPPPIAVPSTANGTGYADYVISDGCSGTVQELGAIDYCANFAYIGFVVPLTADSVTFTFSYNGTGNDGPDKVFLINALTPTPHEDPGPPVPEPSTLLLLGGGLLVAAREFRRYRQ